MFKKLTFLFALIFSCAAFAIEGILAATIAVNLDDQTNHVPGTRPLHISALSDVVCDQPFSLRIGIARPVIVDGRAKVTGTLKMFAPGKAGKVLFKDKMLFDQPCDGNGIFISPLMITIVFQKNDKAGEYRFELELTDRNDNDRTFSVEPRVIKLESSPSDLAPMDEAGFNKLLENYYRSPEPRRLIAAYNYFIKSDQLNRKRRGYTPQIFLRWFAETLKINPQLWVEFAGCNRNLKDPVLKNYAAKIIVQMGDEPLQKMMPHLDPEIVKLVQRAGGRSGLQPVQITCGADMDLLWAEFFATGNFEPVRRLINELRKREFISPEEARKRSALAPDEKVKLMNFILMTAARWSLESNLQKGHALLGYYMEGVLMKKQAPDLFAAAVIESILRRSGKSSGRTQTK